MDESLTGTLIMQLVESVIQLRRAGELRDGYAHEIAASCLRLAGLGPAGHRPRPRGGRQPGGPACCVKVVERSPRGGVRSRQGCS